MSIHERKHSIVTRVTSPCRFVQDCVSLTVRNEKCLNSTNVSKGIYLGDVNERTFPEQLAQTHRPHNLQWCLRRLQPNERPHLMHVSVFPSGIQIAGTKCSTFPLLGICATSSGRCGSACSVRRKWFVDEEDVNVELAFIALSDTKREALASRIAVAQSSRSSSQSKTTHYKQ